jgi:hypothetical protein
LLDLALLFLTNRKLTIRGTTMIKKTKTKEIDIHCACAIGDLSELTKINPANKTETKIRKKILKKDDLKKEDSNHK